MNFSLSEILVILLVALLVIKPDQLPEVAYKLGRFSQHLKRILGRIKREMNEFIDTSETSNNKKKTSSESNKVER